MSSGIPSGWLGLDVGEKSVVAFSAVIEKANTIIWNGPVGVFEFDNFSKGSRAVLESICMATEKGATSIIGEGIFYFFPLSNFTPCLWSATLTYLPPNGELW